MQWLITESRSNDFGWLGSSCGHLLHLDQTSFFRQRARSVPICAAWKRTCPAWISYATTLLSAFGWRRRPALRDKNPFSSKWPKDGLRSPSTPRRRKQDRHFVKIVEVAASISWTRRGEAFRRKSSLHIAKPRVEPQHLRAVQQRNRITDDAP